MARRLFGLGLNVERALKTNLLLVVDGHVHELAQVVQLAFHVGVQQRRVPFASAPEHVALTAQLVGPFHGLLYLRCGEAKSIRVAAGGCSMHVARVDEVLSRTPEQTDAGVFLELLQFVADRIELRIGLLEVLAVGTQVPVMPGVVGNPQLGGELEERTRPRDRVLSGALAGIPGTIGGSPAEHITTGSPHGVPIDRGEAHVVAHRLAFDHLIRIEVLEGQGILGIRTFVGDPADLGEELLAHVGLEKGRGKLRTDPDDGKRLKLITGRLLRRGLTDTAENGVEHPPPRRIKTRHTGAHRKRDVINGIWPGLAGGPCRVQAMCVWLPVKNHLPPAVFDQSTHPETQQTQGAVHQLMPR